VAGPFNGAFSGYAGPRPPAEPVDLAAAVARAAAGRAIEVDDGLGPLELPEGAPVAAPEPPAVDPAPTPARAAKRQPEGTPDRRDPIAEALTDLLAPFTDAELEAARKPHPHLWAGPHGAGLLPVGEVALVAGAHREGKTRANVALAAAGALGRELAGMRPAGAFSTAILSAEDDRLSYGRMLVAHLDRLPTDQRRLLRERVLVPDLDHPAVRDSRKLVRMLDRQPLVAAEVESIIAALEPLTRREHAPLKLVILETASTLSEAPEDNPGLARLSEACKLIARRLGVAVILSHHLSQAAGQQLSSLDLDGYSVRGATSLVANTRQTCLLVNLGDEADPFPDDDARTILRRMALPRERGRVSMLAVVDSSKSARPAPLFMAWRDGASGPAAEFVEPSADLRGMGWHSLKRRVAAEKAEAKAEERRSRVQAKEDARATKVDRAIEAARELEAAGQPATMRAISLRLGYQSGDKARPFVDRAVAEGELERVELDQGAGKRPLVAFRPVELAGCDGVELPGW